MPRICQFENCRKVASYALTYCKPDRCKEHKEDRKPQYAICRCGNAKPTYNLLDESRPECCRLCKSSEMVNVVRRYCLCRRSTAHFNEPGETKPICCAICKKSSMVNVVTPRCICGKAQPSCNEPGETKPICCAICRSSSMVNVVTPLCICGKHQPSFNEPNETKPICCSICKSITMVNVKTNRCICGKHQPYFNESGKKVAICCSICKTESMVDVISKKCKGQDGSCTTAANPKYKNYCVYCFANTFPTDPLTYQIRSKTKEIATRDFINDHFEGFIHDKPMYTAHCDCSIRRRIDHRKLIGNTMFAIETDENAHKSYDAMDEEIRYDDLFNAFSGKWIYIRFNPDKFRNKAGVSKNPTIATRLIELKTEIERQIQRIEAEENTELLEIKYMYYDGYA